MTMSTLQRLKILGYLPHRLLPCKQCSEGWGRHQHGHCKIQPTIAVDRDHSYGSKVMIGGVIYTQRTGGGVKGNTSISSSTPRTDAARKADEEVFWCRIKYNNINSNERGRKVSSAIRWGRNFGHLCLLCDIVYLAALCRSQ